MGTFPVWPPVNSPAREAVWLKFIVDLPLHIAVVQCYGPAKATHHTEKLMGKITLDPSLKVKLNGLNEPLELCDERGTTVGHFLPEDTYRKYFYAWLKSQVSDEEIDRLRQEKGGKTLAEIKDGLGLS
jgi:hypothetical protein